MSYSERHWLGDSLLAAAHYESTVSIDYRDPPSAPPWRLTLFREDLERGTHLSRDLEVAWLEDVWRFRVRMRREERRLVGVEGPDPWMDTIEVALPAGASFFTDLSLNIQLAAWPLDVGWERRGFMHESRRSNRAVPVRIRVVGEEVVPTPSGPFDCWIVVVQGPARRRRQPHWYWVSKEHRFVVMRRKPLAGVRGGIEELLVERYSAPSQILIDVVAVVPPRDDAAAHISTINAIGADLGRSGYMPSGTRYDSETLTRFTVTTEPYRVLTSSDSVAVARIMAERGGRFRIESPVDRAFVTVSTPPMP